MTSWASLPEPGATAALLEHITRHPEADFDIRLLHVSMRALILHSMAAEPGPPRRPHAIMQYWDQPQPPDDVLHCLDNWRAAGPPLLRFCDEAAIEWLRGAYGEEVLEAYHFSHHPSMRSDILRVAWLLREGGLYMDADDLFDAEVGLPDFHSAMVLLPLAQHGPEIVPIHHGLNVAASGEYVGFFANTAPIYADVGHPVLERALRSTLAHLHGCKARGERGHSDLHTGPSNFSRALLDHLIACHRSGEACNVSLQPDWPWLKPFQALEYKKGPRNWRTGSVIY